MRKDEKNGKEKKDSHDLKNIKVEIREISSKGVKFTFQVLDTCTS